MTVIDIRGTEAEQERYDAFCEWCLVNLPLASGEIKNGFAFRSGRNPAGYTLSEFKKSASARSLDTEWWFRVECDDELAVFLKLKFG